MHSKPLWILLASATMALAIFGLTSLPGAPAAPADAALATCRPYSQGPCYACKNCRYCGNCNSGGECTVCK